MAQSFSIDDMRAEIAQRGILKTSRFRVDVGMPPALSGTTYKQTGTDLITQAADGTLSMWCEQASLPGVELEHYPLRRYGYGAIENRPFAPRFADSRLVFRSDGTGLIHTFLHSWMRVALNYDNQGSINSLNGAVPGQFTYELSYKTDYVQNVRITQFNDAGDVVLSVVLLEAYPVYVGSVPLNWGSVNEYSYVPVTLTYVGWYSDGEKPVAINQ